MGNNTCAKRKDDVFYAGRFVKHHYRICSTELKSHYGVIKEHTKEKVFEAQFKMKLKH